MKAIKSGCLWLLVLVWLAGMGAMMQSVVVSYHAPKRVAPTELGKWPQPGSDGLTVARPKPQKKRKFMPNYSVVGAGDVASRGLYVEQTPYLYQKGSTRFLFQDSSYHYYIGPDTDSANALYQNDTLGSGGPPPETGWYAVAGSAPAPTVIEGAYIPAPTITNIDSTKFHLGSVTGDYEPDGLTAYQDGVALANYHGTAAGNTDFYFPGAASGTNIVLQWKKGATSGPTSIIAQPPVCGGVTVTPTTVATPIPAAISAPAACVTATKLQVLAGGSWSDVDYTATAGNAVIDRADLPDLTDARLRWRLEFAASPGGDGFAIGTQSAPFSYPPTDAPAAPVGTWIYPWDKWRITVPALVARATAYSLISNTANPSTGTSDTVLASGLVAGSTYDFVGLNGARLFYQPYNGSGYGPNGATAQVPSAPLPAKPAKATVIPTGASDSAGIEFAVTAPAMPQYGLELELFRVTDTANNVELSLGVFNPGQAKTFRFANDIATGQYIRVKAKNHAGTTRGDDATLFAGTAPPPVVVGPGDPPPTTPPDDGDPDTPPVDTTAPIVTIETPTAGERAGTIPILATATDATGVVEVKFFYNDLLLDTLTAPNSDGKYLHVWNTLSPQIANGSKTIRVEARDAAGNVGTASVTIDLQNSLANLTVKVVSNVLPTPTMEESWKIGTQVIKRVLVEHLISSVSPEEFDNYRCQWLVHVPGDSVDEKDYQLLTPFREQLILNSGSSFRLILLMTPVGVRSFWELNADLVLQMFAYNDGADKLAIQTSEPAKLVSFDGKNITTLYDLTTLDAEYELLPAYAENRWYFGLNDRDAIGRPVLRAMATSGSVAYDVQLLDVPARIVAVCGDGGDRILCALNMVEDDVETEGRIVAFNPGAGADALQVLAAGLQPLSAMAFAEDTVLAGGVSGEVYADGALLGNVGNQVAALDKIESTVYAGTMDVLDDGQWWRVSNGSVQLEVTLDSHAAIALSKHDEKLWAGGASAMLYRRDGAGWNEIETVADATDVRGLASFDSGLMVAVSGAGEVGARLWKRETSAGDSGFLARQLGQMGVLARRVAE